jgi:hypothetical protein
MACTASACIACTESFLHRSELADPLWRISVCLNPEEVDCGPTRSILCWRGTVRSGRAAGRLDTDPAVMCRIRRGSGITGLAGRTITRSTGRAGGQVPRDVSADSEGVVKPGDPLARVPRHSRFLALRLLENEGKCFHYAPKHVEDHGLLLSRGDRRPLLPGGPSQFVASSRRAAEYVSRQARSRYPLICSCHVISRKI